MQFLVGENESSVTMAGLFFGEWRVLNTLIFRYSIIEVLTPIADVDGVVCAGRFSGSERRSILGTMSISETSSNHHVDAATEEVFGMIKQALDVCLVGGSLSIPVATRGFYHQTRLGGR